MLVRMRIFIERANKTITITDLSEPSIIKDILQALSTDLEYSGWGNDIITKAEFYLYDNIKEWVIILTKNEE